MYVIKGIDQRGSILLTYTMATVQFSKQNPLVQLIINLFALGIKGERTLSEDLVTYCAPGRKTVKHVAFATFIID